MSYLSPERQARVESNAKVVDHFLRRQSVEACRDVDFERYTLPRKKYQLRFLRCELESFVFEP